MSVLIASPTSETHSFTDFDTHGGGFRSVHLTNDLAARARRFCLRAGNERSVYFPPAVSSRVSPPHLPFGPAGFQLGGGNLELASHELFEKWTGQGRQNIAIASDLAQPSPASLS